MAAWIREISKRSASLIGPASITLRTAAESSVQHITVLDPRAFGADLIKQADRPRPMSSERFAGASV
jgi:hypothetical protein